ncbi:hypothetical protein POPTR_016G090500v4 [Populus trichocarpa]|uniref:Uncharacterized protein n=1 Tax=Populus trichocarpa TaxID=3694 RepID=A0ACC0RU20_POPTR|nr:hypothetical protein POPTR_016G090500v4 [Populus trichocarpa]
MEIIETTTLQQQSMSSKFKRICVFCGSSQGKKTSYQVAAIDLGNELVSRNIDLVYGGGSIGLMGLVSQAVHDGGRHVIGVIPKTLMPRELTGETVGEVKAVADMHQRKAEMAKHSDAFIALPGGYGTLEELLEVITWAQLGIHDKPVISMFTILIPCYALLLLDCLMLMDTTIPYSRLLTKLWKRDLLIPVHATLSFLHQQQKSW